MPKFKPILARSAACAPQVSHTLITAGGFTKDTAEAIIEAGVVDLVAFARHFVFNPDLPERSVPLSS
jgi:2,4-dienoyl-CoA reductase-like NADH-dependent reductase (Old Yellow Enzyme family)